VSLRRGEEAIHVRGVATSADMTVRLMRSPVHHAGLQRLQIKVGAQGRERKAIQANAASGADGVSCGANSPRLRK